MAAKNMVISERLAHIASELRNVAQQVMQPAQDISDAAKDLQELRDGTTSAKERLMIQVAQMSAAEAWTKGEIDAASKEAGKVNANRGKDDKPTVGEKAMGVFISDLRQCANPTVAPVFTSFVNMRDDAWNQEDDAYKADKESPRPCRKLWQRRYHMLMAMVRDTIDGKASFTTTQDVVRYAVVNDPDLDIERIKLRLASVVQSLTAIYNDFRHDDIKCAIDFLGVLDADDLRASRAQQVATSAPAIPNEPASAPVVIAKPVKNTKPVPPAAPSTILALDDIDAMINDNGVAAAAQAAQLARLNGLTTA